LHADSGTEKKSAVVDDHFPPEVVEDLKHHIKQYNQEIQRKFANFVSSIFEKIFELDVNVVTFRFFLLNLPALACDDGDEHHKLLYGIKNELCKAVSIEKIFLLLRDYLSFLDYQTYLDIAVKYKIEIKEEESEYLKHLNEYAKRHTISDLVDVLPKLHKCTDKFTEASKTIVFKLNVKLSCKFAKVVDLKSALAKLLGFHPSAMRFISIEKGSILISFVVPFFAAEYIFYMDKKFSQQEKEQFQALSIVWLDYDNRKFNFATNMVSKLVCWVIS
jgi:hypothetical protein